MFYSQTFLARKGPLGTVWCAAHLHHRLKKSQYAATDIPSAVEHIMFPEVPIALRMSSHLLLGVVRIYSKKVDYLFHDCNCFLIELRKVFASIQVNLPDDARQAPIQAITLPETFELDAMEFDDDMCIEGALNDHLSSQEDITLRDQIPVGIDPYVAVTFDEDIVMDESFTDVLLKSGSLKTNENLHEPPETRNVGSPDPGQHNQVEQPSETAAFQDPGQSNQRIAHEAAELLENAGPVNQTQLHDSISIDSSQDIPETERMRDASSDFYAEKATPVSSDHRNDPSQVTGSLDDVLKEKEIQTPSLNILSSAGPSMPFQQQSDPPASASSKGPPEVSLVCASPQLVVQPSPPVHQPRQRRIKRKFFDEKLVLPNRLMKRVLEDCGDLVRKRRKIPFSALGVWKLNNRQRTEQVISEPSLTGLCADICDMFNREYISMKPHLIAPKEVVPEPTVPESTAPATDISELRTGQCHASIPALERLRDNEIDVPELGSYQAGSMSSPFRRDGSPFSTNSLELELAPESGSTSTPVTLLGEQSFLKDTGFSAIPQVGSSEADLYFLEADANSPTESLAGQEVDSLSVRTRTVAKYLKEHSPTSSTSEGPHGDVSLNKILEGKTRKICARMFFETLVLKTYDLVDVRQEQPYGDIILTLAPALSKAI